jgi:hypothetical protein
MNVGVLWPTPITLRRVILPCSTNRVKAFTSRFRQDFQIGDTAIQKHDGHHLSKKTGSRRKPKARRMQKKILRAFGFTPL